MGGWESEHLVGIGAAPNLVKKKKESMAEVSAEGGRERRNTEYKVHGKHKSGCVGGKKTFYLIIKNYRHSFFLFKNSFQRIFS